MKFDPFNWSKVSVEKVYEAPLGGRVWVRASQPVNLFVEVDGYEVLAGSGQEIDIQTQAEDGVKLRVEGGNDAAVFLYSPQRTVFEPSDGETFTNIDRKPLESGSVLEVQRAMRMLRLEERAMMARVRAARGEIEGEDKGEAKPEPKPDEKPEGETQKADA